MRHYNPSKCGICQRLHGRHRASCAYLNNPSAPRHGHPTKDDIRRFEDAYNRQEDRREEIMHGPPVRIIGLHP